jgi:predicted Zn-dependent protease
MREDEEALKVLLPLFESDASGIRAALSIIRIYNRANRRDDARAVLRRAERYAPSDMSSFTATARVEVMFAFAQWQEAVEYLRVEKQKDPSLVGLFLEAIVRAASGSSDSALANQYLREGVAAAIPEELTLNVPVQVNRARLGVAAKDSDLFEGAMHNLRQTRIDRRELERLQELWDAQ